MSSERSAYWTEHDAELIDKWNRGFSAGEIGQVFGISRNAVIGRMHRLKRKGVELREHKTQSAAWKEECERKAIRLAEIARAEQARREAEEARQRAERARLRALAEFRSEIPGKCSIASCRGPAQPGRGLCAEHIARGIPPNKREHCFEGLSAASHAGWVR